MSGTYCGSCGQKHVPDDEAGLLFLYSVLFDWWPHMVRAVRDAGWLLVQPGKLTADYLVGKRASQTHPWTLWMAVWVLHSALMLLCEDPAWYLTSDIAESTRSELVVIGKGAVALGQLLQGVTVVAVMPLAARWLLGSHSRGAVAHAVFAMHVSGALMLAEFPIAVYTWMARDTPAYEPVLLSLLLVYLAVFLAYPAMAASRVYKARPALGALFGWAWFGFVILRVVLVHNFELLFQSVVLSRL
jgi:hypothetical protein